jgi:WD40 repeat protein
VDLDRKVISYFKWDKLFGHGSSSSILKLSNNRVLIYARGDHHIVLADMGSRSQRAMRSEFAIQRILPWDSSSDTVLVIGFDGVLALWNISNRQFDRVDFNHVQLVACSTPMEFPTVSHLLIADSRVYMIPAGAKSLDRVPLCDYVDHRSIISTLSPDTMHFVLIYVSKENRDAYLAWYGSDLSKTMIRLDSTPTVLDCLDRDGLVFVGYEDGRFDVYDINRDRLMVDVELWKRVVGYQDTYSDVRTGEFVESLDEEDLDDSLTGGLGNGAGEGGGEGGNDSGMGRPGGSGRKPSILRGRRQQHPIDKNQHKLASF